MATGTWTYDSGTATYTYTDTTGATIKVNVSGVTGIDGLKIDEDTKEVTVSEASLGTDPSNPATIITKNATEDSEVTGSDAYTFQLGADVNEPKKSDPDWEIDPSAGTAEYNEVTSAGYTLDATDSKTITYSAAETDTLVKLTGVNTTKSLEDIKKALEVSGTVITVGLAALGDNGIKIDEAGGTSDYTLALGDVAEATADDPQWAVTTNLKKSTTVTYQQATEINYKVKDGDQEIERLINPEPSTKVIELAKIEGLAAGLTVNDITNGGINVTGDSDEIFNLHLKVLGGAVNLKTLVHPDTDTDYKLSLDEDATKPQCSWTVSNKGVAAYNKVKPITYKVVDDTTITALGKAVTTTLATVSGVNSGLIGASADKLDEILVVKEKDGTTDPGAEGATITLGKEAFGMANLTYANANGSKYEFSANTTDVPSSSSGVGPAWVINGTTATYINCESQAYYTVEDVKDKKGNVTGQCFEYHAPVPATGAQPQITITGLKKGVTLQGDGTINGISFKIDNTTDPNNPVVNVTVSKELFGGTNIAISGKYYDETNEAYYDCKLQFDATEFEADKDTNLHVTEAGTTYAYTDLKKGASSITQDVKAGYTLTANGKGIIYSKKEGAAVIATVAGINNSKLTADNFNATTGVITLTEAQLPTNAKGATVTVTGTGGCTLATAVATIKESEPAWSVSGTTATYKSTMDPNGTPAYSIAADGKSLFYLVKAKDTVIATVNGINANLTAKDFEENATATPPVKSAISFKADGNGEETIIVLQQRALTSANVSAAAGYTIDFGTGVYKTKEEAEAAPAKDTWVVSGTKAELISCTPAYYEYKSDKKGITYVYHKAEPVAAGEEAKVTLTGLKKNLMVNADGSIDGITYKDEDGDGTNDTIVLDSKVLGGGTVTVNGGYKLALDSTDTGLDISTISYKWEPVKNKKTQAITGMTLTQTRTNGYDVSDDGKTITHSYNKKGDSTTTSLFTLTGIKEDYLKDDNNWGTYNKDNAENKISLVGDTVSINDAAVLGDTALTVGAKSAYKLAINFSTGAAITDNKWEIVPGKKGAISYAYNRVVTGEGGGYALSADAKTISNMKENDSVTLVTINGLNEDLIVRNGENKIDAAATNTAIKDATIVAEEAGTVTLKKAALGTSVISVAKGSTYKIQLADDANIKTSAAEDVSSNGWVVSGTTAKYQTYKNGYYTHNAAKNTITYTPPSAGTTGGATVTLTGLKKGIAANQDGEIDGVKVENRLITLKKSALGTTDVTLIGTDGYVLALYSNADEEPEEVVSPSETTTEWAQNPKNAASWTLNQQDTAGFKLSDDKTATYSAGTKPMALFTLNGLKSDLADTDLTSNIDISADGKVTLKSGALGGTNVTLALPKNSTAYTLALDEEILQREKTANEPQWIVEGTKAIYYNKCNMPYYTVSDNTVTYTPAATTKDSNALITITGLRKGTTLADGDISIEGTEVTLSEALLTGTSKVTVSDGYTLALADESLKSEPEDPIWTVTTKKGTTATLTQVQPKGYICNGSSITAVPKQTTATLLTLSGINASLITAAEEAATNLGGDAAEAKKQEVYNAALAVDTKNEKVTIGEGAIVAGGTIAVGKGNVYTIKAKTEAAVTVTGKEWSINTKKNNATYTETKEAGNVTSADGKSIKNSITETKTALVTIGGFNPDLTEEKLNDKNTTPIIIDTAKQKITLKKDALDPSRTVVIGTKGSPYTFELNSDVTTNPEEKDGWVITGGKKDSTAEYIMSTPAHYELSANKNSVSYVPTTAKAGEPTQIKITGLAKGAVVSNDNITLSASGTVVTLKESILGTGTITIEGAKIKLYDDVTVSELGNPKWNFNLKKNVASATLTQEKPAGYVLADDGKTVTYVAKPTVVTLATVSGINPKLLDGITDEAKQQEKLNAALAIKDNTITLNNQAIVAGTTTNVTLTRGKDINGKATAYELAIDASADSTGKTDQWYVDGQTVKYIKCDDAHYELAENKLSISYQKVKPSDGAEAQATISGLRKKFSTTDINEDVKIKKVEGGTSQVVVSENLLDRSGTVTLDGDYTFEFDEELAKTDKAHYAKEIEQVWTNTSNKKGVIGTLTQKREIGYTISNDGKSIMNLTKLPKGGSLVMATVTGLKDVNETLTSNPGDRTIGLGASDLREDGGAVVVDGAGYTFDFAQDYTEGKTITAGNSGNKITAAGDKLTINGGKGNDNITASGQEANINGGAGNDVITTDNDSSGATVAGGAGDDNITFNGKGNNTYVYNIGEGNDVINKFHKDDKIKLASYVGSTSDAVKLAKVGSDLVVTVAVGAKKKQGTITLVGAGDQTSVSFLDKNDKALDDISLDSGSNAVEDPVVPTNELLYSSNYSQDAAQLDQVTPTSVNDYSVGDINTNQDATALTQNATIVTTSTNKK